MKILIAGLFALAIGCTRYSQAYIQVYDELSLRMAMELANNDASFDEIEFKPNSQIKLSAPVIYTGNHPLKIIGNGATIDGSEAGRFELDDDLNAITRDGSLIFNTASGISIKNLSIKDSATRGIVVNTPAGATGTDVIINLNQVIVTNSALYGLHIDDEFDDGVTGSAIGIELFIVNSSFTSNGIGAIDFDGIRIDERAKGDISVTILHSEISQNGGDGIELDEAGDGDVEAILCWVRLNDNGFFNEDDLDDAFDIDEADNGDIEVNMSRVELKRNGDEGLDFDESGEGSLKIRLRRVDAVKNTDEGIKLNEEDDGNIDVKMSKVNAIGNGDDGLQFTETGIGLINAYLSRLRASDNAKFGLKMEQWLMEDENTVVEPAGYLKKRKLELLINGSGDSIKLKNIETD